MTVRLDFVVDFMAVPSVIPLDENCPKCAFFMQRARCSIDYWRSTAHRLCDGGAAGYFSQQVFPSTGAPHITEVEVL